MVKAIVFIFSFLTASFLADVQVNEIVPAAPVKPTPTEFYGNVWNLDGHDNYWLFWKSNTTHITFETHVKTKGYVGFGLTSNGKMFPSDVVVGWVDSTGTTHFKDCHTVGHFTPIEDKSQDFALLIGKEDDFGTMLKFSRKLDTCDDKDYRITDDTIKVIWSYHPNDPSSLDTLSYHGSDRRGTNSLMLLSAVKQNEYVPPAGARHFDMLHHKYHVPPRDTTYECKIFKVPQLKQKFHMIRFEPVITPGNENHVHHILVYNCPTAIDADVGHVFNCYGRRPGSTHSCNNVIIAWAVGGVAFNFPPDAGFSFGTDGDPKYLLMETHYNNPTLKSDIIDSSGIRVTATPHLRPHDAGLMELGALVNRLQLVPPHEKSFMSRHYCNAQCMNKGLQSPTNSIKVFAVLLHAHLLGVHLKARHIRGDTELQPLSDDATYDFDFQDFRTFTPHKEIKYGDQIITECIYDSSQKTKPTLGGLPTTAEMCLSFLYYYPKMPISRCLSEPLYDNIGTDPFRSLDDIYKWNWNDQNVRDRYKGILQNTTYYQRCSGEHVHHSKSDPQQLFKAWEPAQKYTPPARQCPTN